MEIQFDCAYCNKPFLKDKKRVKKGHKPCCSRICSSQYANSKNGNRDLSKLDPFNKIDGHTHFRYFIHNMKEASRRDTRKMAPISIEELKTVWVEQGGICPLTGWKLLLPPDSRGWGEIGVIPNRASVDRINNQKGYSKDNIRFVAFIANVARNRFSDDDLIAFCHAVASKNPPMYNRLSVAV